MSITNSPQGRRVATMTDRKTIMTLMERLGPLADDAGIDRLSLFMDVEYSGVNMGALAVVDEQTFVHDVAGIYKHFDRDTKTLGGCFVPRVGFADENKGEGTDNE